MCQIEDKDDEKDIKSQAQNICTEFFEWSCKHFVQPIMRLSDEEDCESNSYLQRSFRFDRNTRVKEEARDEQLKAGQYTIVILFIIFVLMQFFV